MRFFKGTCSSFNKGKRDKTGIARTFARIFFRNSINIGLPVLTSMEAAENIDDGDELEVDLDKGEIKDLTNGKKFDIKPVPDFIQEIISSGGYINYTKETSEESNNIF